MRPNTSSASVEEITQPSTGIFLSISSHHYALAPGRAVSTIYPRYL